MHFPHGYCYDITIGASWWCFRELFQAKNKKYVALDFFCVYHIYVDFWLVINKQQ